MRISDWSSDVCSSDLAAHHPESLAERALDDREAIHLPLALGDAAAVRAVEANGVHLVEVGHGAVLLGDLAKLGDRRDVAVHGIDRLEGDQLGGGRVGLAQQAVEVLGIVMARSEEHTSEIQSLMRISYAVFCFKKKNKDNESN